MFLTRSKYRNMERYYRKRLEKLAQSREVENINPSQ